MSRRFRGMALWVRVLHLFVGPAMTVPPVGRAGVGGTSFMSGGGEMGFRATGSRLRRTAVVALDGALAVGTGAAAGTLAHVVGGGRHHAAVDGPGGAVALQPRCSRQQPERRDRRHVVPERDLL